MMPEELAQKAEVLVEALPYIKRFYGKTMVLKYGGGAMEAGGLKEAFAQDVALLWYVGIRPVIVHGGGPQIGMLLEKLGITSSFVQGMRVTDPKTMEVVEMVLSKLNKDLVYLINRQGAKAVGLSGKDARLIKAKKMTLKGVDLGLVGEVEEVNAELIEALQKEGFVPVIAPIGVSEGGETYNINADTVAGAVASALKAEKLLLLTDVPGVYGPNNKLIPTLSARDAEALIADGIIEGGMIPKVKCCIDALRMGVKKAHILDGRLPHALLLEVFTDKGIGTEIVP